MNISRILDFRIFLTLGISLLLGAIFVEIAPLLVAKPKFFVLLPLGVVFLLFLIIRPKQALVVILMARPILDQAMESTRLGGMQGMGIGSIFNLGIILIFVLLYFKNSAVIAAPKKFIFWWIIYLLILLVSIVYSPFVLRAVRLYLNHITYFSMAVLPFLLIKRKQDFFFWIKVLIISFILPILFANIDMATGGRYYNPDSGRRIVGTFTHPNILAFFLLLGITLYFFVNRSRAFHLSSKMRIGINILIANMAVLLIAAKTRSAWIAAFLVYFLYGWLKEKRIILVLLVMCCVAALTPAVQDRVVTMFGSGGSEQYEGVDSFNWRLQAWGATFKPIFEKPLHGHGLASFFRLSSQFSEHGENFGSHNLYLEIWFESGVFALLSYCMLLLTTFRIFWDKVSREKDPVVSRLAALMASYVVSYIIVCVSDNLAYYLVFNWYFWFFVGLAMVGIPLLKNDSVGGRLEKDALNDQRFV